MDEGLRCCNPACSFRRHSQPGKEAPGHCCIKCAKGESPGHGARCEFVTWHTGEVDTVTRSRCLLALGFDNAAPIAAVAAASGSARDDALRLQAALERADASKAEIEKALYREHDKAVKMHQGIIQLDKQKMTMVKELVELDEAISRDEAQYAAQLAAVRELEHKVAAERQHRDKLAAQLAAAADDAPPKASRKAEPESHANRKKEQQAGSVDEASREKVLKAAAWSTIHKRSFDDVAPAPRPIIKVELRKPELRKPALRLVLPQKRVAAPSRQAADDEQKSKKTKEEPADDEPHTTTTPPVVPPPPPTPPRPIIRVPLRSTTKVPLPNSSTIVGARTTQRAPDALKLSLIHI